MTSVFGPRPEANSRRLVRVAARTLMGLGGDKIERSTWVDVQVREIRVTSASAVSRATVGGGVVFDPPQASATNGTSIHASVDLRRAWLRAIVAGHPLEPPPAASFR